MKRLFIFLREGSWASAIFIFICCAVVAFSFAPLISSFIDSCLLPVDGVNEHLKGSHKAEKRHVNLFYPYGENGSRVIEVVRFEEHDYLFVHKVGYSNQSANFLHSESCAKCEKEKLFLKK